MECTRVTSCACLRMALTHFKTLKSSCTFTNSLAIRLPAVSSSYFKSSRMSFKCSVSSISESTFSWRSSGSSAIISAASSVSSSSTSSAISLAKADREFFLESPHLPRRVHLRFFHCRVISPNKWHPQSIALRSTLRCQHSGVRAVAF